MIKRRMKGFTLIELIAVLVILAILALIVTPLVMNIVKKAKDSSNKRSVDAYGKSVELAVATYLLDNGDYPDSLDNLTVEYSGNEVTCLTKTLNSDGSIYLSGCSVKNTEVLDSNNADGYYHFGRLTGGTVTPEPENPTVGYDEYEIGDEVTYNNVDYYVIKDSDSTEANVTLLKKTPLTVAEVNQYGGVGTENNHVNKYTEESQGTAYDYNGYGGMAYYSSANCGYGEDSNNPYSGCTSDYASSEVKYVVDAWKEDKASLASEARLITYDELMNDLGYSHGNQGASYISVNTEFTPSWVYNSQYWYWIMSPYNDSSSNVWSVGRSGGLRSDYVDDSYGVVRPVITISKPNL